MNERPRVPLIGGVVHRDGARPVTTGLLQRMAARVAPAADVGLQHAGRAAMFASGDVGGLARHVPLLAVVDMDVLGPAAPAPGPPTGAWFLDAVRVRTARAAIERLRGAFAVAVWDDTAGELVLGVDRFGMKRLYYLATPAGLAFSSRASALVGFHPAAEALDPAAAYQYLNFGYVPAPVSIFSGVRRLPPGHLLRLRDGTATVERYWDLSYTESAVGLTGAIASTQRMVEQAVAVAVAGGAAKETGAFLSGGTDSSTVVGLIGRVTGERANAFSIGFREESYNELHYAELAARQFNAAHFTAVVGPDDAFAALPRVVEAYDEPFGNDSTIPTYLCAQLARDSGMVRLLAGDGGDEIFGGNERYRTDRIFGRYQGIPGPLRRGLVEPLLGVLPGGERSVVDRARRYVRRANIPNPRRFYSYEFLVAREATELLAPDVLEAVDREAPWHTLEAHFARAQARSELNRLMYLDMKLTIGDSDLFKVTRSAELAGIGVRFPKLDPDLVEFTATLPARYKVRGLEKRYLFKRAFRPLLPPAIVAKPKHGFGLPVSTWLRTHAGFHDLARSALLSPTAFTRSLFRRGAVEELFRLHGADSTAYYGSILWTVLMLELWAGRHVTSQVAA